MKYENMTWRKQRSILHKAEKIAKGYGLKTIFESDHFNIIFIPSNDRDISWWDRDYPGLDAIMDKYDLFDVIKLVPEPIKEAQN